MTIHLKFSLTLLVALVGWTARADLSSSDQEALRKTQELLRNQQQREKYMKESPDARANHQQLEKLTGNKQTTDSVYGLSAEIFAEIAKDTNGDPVLMQQKLMEAQKNPEAFLKSLPAQHRKAIEEIAGRINSNRGPSGKP